MKKQYYFDEAERLFIRGKTIKEIAQLLGVSERTLARWKKEGRWEEKRKNYMKNPVGLGEKIEELLRRKVEELASLPASEVTTKMIDELSKLVAALEKIRKAASFPSQAIVVFDRFSSYIKEVEKDEEFLERLSKHIQGFFEKILKEERR